MHPQSTRAPQSPSTRTQRHDLTGQRFGRLTAVAPAASQGDGHRRWVCRCDCGATIEVRAGNLRSGNTRSCGCLQAEVRERKARKHGKTDSPAYWRWRAMIQRCTNPRNHAWADYGGRGIRVCDRWRSFDAFYADMGDPPSGMTLDRIDVNGDYRPDNCRWATPRRQARNTRKTPMLTHDGRTQSLMDWADELGVSMHLIHDRLRRGWSVSDALTKPARRTRKGGR